MCVPVCVTVCVSVFVCVCLCTHTYVTRSHKMVLKSILGATEILIYSERGENADYYGEKNYCGECKNKEVMAS